MKIWNFGVNALQLHLFCPHNTKLEIAAVFTAAISSFGGPDRIRTDDPYNANVVRSQLRYRPLLAIFQSKKLRKMDF